MIEHQWRATPTLLPVSKLLQPQVQGQQVRQSSQHTRKGFFLLPEVLGNLMSQANELGRERAQGRSRLERLT
jgi:hypothetical protein